MKPLDDVRTPRDQSTKYYVIRSRSQDEERFSYVDKYGCIGVIENAVDFQSPSGALLWLANQRVKYTGPLELVRVTTPLVPQRTLTVLE